MYIKYEHGFPVVNSKDIDEVLKQLNITKWNMAEMPKSLEDFIKRESVAEVDRLRKFIPRDEVVSFQKPDGQIFRGIRRNSADGVVTFALLPGDLIPICAEFKHGISEISINLPGGGNHNNDELPHIAKEEFEQETGVVLEEIIELSPIGISSDARIHKNRTFYFLGKAKNPLVIKNTKLDEGEILEPLLISLKEWLMLIENNRVIDGQSIICTYLALAHLGFIRV